MLYRVDYSVIQFAVDDTMTQWRRRSFVMSARGNVRKQAWRVAISSAEDEFRTVKAVRIDGITRETMF